MKKVAFTMVLLVCAYVYGQTQNLSQVAGSSVTLVMVKYYLYAPQSDITAFELAQLLPLFSGVSYGMGDCSSREGAIVPVRDRMRGGWPVSGTVLALDDYRAKELGTAIRHLKQLP